MILLARDSEVDFPFAKYLYNSYELLIINILFVIYFDRELL